MDDELCHYGVKGMKWGVRRLSAKRNADTMSREKLQKNIGDFEGRNQALTKIVDRKEKRSLKTSKRNVKSSKRANKTFKRSMKDLDEKGIKKSGKLIKQTKKLSSKNAKLRRQINRAKKEMSKNQNIINLLNTKFSDVKAGSSSTSSKTTSAAKNTTQKSEDFKKKVDDGKEFVKNVAPALATAGISSALMVSGMGYATPLVGAASTVVTQVAKTADKNSDDEKKR